MPIGTSDGQYFENIFDYHKRMSDANEMRANETSGDFQSRFLAANVPNASEVPLEALRKAGDAVVLQGNGYTPEKPVETNSDLNNSRASFGTMGPAEIPFTPPTKREERPPGKTLFETKAGPITEGDVGNAIDVAMNFSGGGLATKRIPITESGKKVFYEGDVSFLKHNENLFTDAPSNIFKASTGHEVDLNKLSNKQWSDFIALHNDYNQGHISLKDYSAEMDEYHKFTQKGGTFDQTHKGETVHPDVSKWDALEPTPVGEPPKFDYNTFVEKYATVAKKENPKLTTKEAFLRGVEETHQALVSSLTEISNKFKNAIKGPLPEPPAPKTAEGLAAEKGYTEPAYRGIKTLGELPSSIHPGFSLYSSNSPLLADMYTSYRSTHPGMKVPENFFDEGAQVMPLYINTKDYHYYNAKGKHWTEANGKAIEEAHRLGKPGVIVDKVFDEPNSTTALGEAKKIFITFKQGMSTVKSRFAERFDESSPDMMHGIGIAGPLGAITIPQKDENP